MRKILIATCALALLAACGGAVLETKKEVVTKEQFDEACVFNAGNGVYRLGNGPCTLRHEEVVAKFIEFHPELEITHLSTTNFHAYVITKKKM